MGAVGILGIAGCASDNEKDEGPDQLGNEPNPTGTGSREQTDTPSEQQERADVELVDYGLLMGETTIQDEEVPWLGWM